MEFSKCIRAALFLAMSQSAFAQEPAPARRAPQPVPLFFQGRLERHGRGSGDASVVTNSDLDLKVYGIGKDDATVNNEGGVPHVWTGLCPAGCAVTLRHKESFADLTG